VVCSLIYASPQILVSVKLCKFHYSREVITSQLAIFLHFRLFLVIKYFVLIIKILFHLSLLVHFIVRQDKQWREQSFGVSHCTLRNGEGELCYTLHIL